MSSVNTQTHTHEQISKVAKCSADHVDIVEMHCDQTQDKCVHTRVRFPLDPPIVCSSPLTP